MCAGGKTGLPRAVPSLVLTWPPLLGRFDLLRLLVMFCSLYPLPLGLRIRPWRFLPCFE